MVCESFRCSRSIQKFFGFLDSVFFFFILHYLSSCSDVEFDERCGNEVLSRRSKLLYLLRDGICYIYSL
jgi:hypothetical protein